MQLFKTFTWIKCLIIINTIWEWWDRNEVAIRYLLLNSLTTLGCIYIAIYSTFQLRPLLMYYTAYGLQIVNSKISLDYELYYN